MRLRDWSLSGVIAGCSAVGAVIGVLVMRWLPGWSGGFLAVSLAGLAGYVAGRRVAQQLRRDRTALVVRATEAERGRAALQHEGAELATLVATVTEGLLSIDGAGRITFINPAARALLGLGDTAIGQPVTVVVRSTEFRELIERVVRGEHVPGTEIALGERRVLTSAQPLAGGHGAVLALADLTALRRLEGVRRDFVANVSHELKTPLTSIRGYIETLQSDDLPPDVRQQFLQVVSKNAERLQRIVDELLDLSMIESGAWQPSPQALSASAVVHDVWQGCQARAVRQRVRFCEPTADVQVYADPGALRQILGNLFDNALRHTPAEGQISVSVQRAGDQAVFEVRDTGTGIPRDALHRIFERFYRVDPARSRAEGGTGLGLAIVKHMVDSMGGTVEAESQLGKGTVMRFTLPAV